MIKNPQSTIIKNPQDITKELKTFFPSVGAKLAKTIPNTEKNFKTYDNEKKQFEELQFDEFEEVFKSLKQNKVTVFDETIVTRKETVWTGRL